MSSIDNDKIIYRTTQKQSNVMFTVQYNPTVMYTRVAKSLITLITILKNDHQPFKSSNNIVNFFCIKILFLNIGKSHGKSTPCIRFLNKESFNVLCAKAQENSQTTTTQTWKIFQTEHFTERDFSPKGYFKNIYTLKKQN